MNEPDDQEHDANEHSKVDDQVQHHGRASHSPFPKTPSRHSSTSRFLLRPFGYESFKSSKGREAHQGRMSLESKPYVPWEWAILLIFS